MKKLFFLLLLLFAYANSKSQISAQPTVFSYGIKLPNATQKIETDVLKIAVIESNGVVKWVNKNDISSSSNHNTLSSLQGGSANQMYHLNASQYAWVLSQLYSNHSATFTLSTTSGERGVQTTNTINYNILSNDDVITAATINQGVGNVISNVNSGNKTISTSAVSESTTYVLTINYTRNGNSASQARNVAYYVSNPQWFGSSILTDITTSDYANLIAGNGFSKYVGTSTKLTYNANTSSNAYVWFISTVNTESITASGFATTVGAWGDNSAFFWKKQLPSFVLSNGSTTATMYLYRTRLLQNTEGSTISFIFN